MVCYPLPAHYQRWSRGGILRGRLRNVMAARNGDGI